ARLAAGLCGWSRARMRKCGARFRLHLGTLRRNSGLNRLIDSLASGALSATAPSAPAAATMPFPLANFALRNNNCVRTALAFGFGSHGLVEPLFILGQRCNADRRTRFRLFGRFLSQFAQLLRLFGGSQR